MWLGSVRPDEAGQAWRLGAADKPASKDFLTDEILKKQIDKWPISDIRILDDIATASMGTVHVTAKFGDQTSDETLFLEERDGEWKLKQGAIKLDIGQTRSYTEAASKTLTLFGRPVGDDSLRSRSESLAVKLSAVQWV